MRVRTSKAVVAAAAALMLATSACSGSGSQPAGTKGNDKFAACGSSPDTCNSGTPKAGGELTYTIEKPITGWNLNDALSSTFDFNEVLDGVLPGAFTANPDLKPALNTDVMVSAKQTATSPQTLVYKIQQDAEWSDGAPIDASDLKYAWYTSDPAHCPSCEAASTAGYSQIKSMTASQDNKTVTVVMKTPFTDWRSMFGTLYPAHIAAQHGSLTTAPGLAASFKWFNQNRPRWSGGPYVITGYSPGASVTEQPNAMWYGKVKPTLDTLVFRIITDQTQEVPALTNKEVDVIYPQPDSDIVTTADNISGVQTYLGKGLTWEHLDLNEANPLLKDKTLRTAIFTAINREDIIKRTVGQFVPGITPLGSHIYVPGQPGYKDVVTSTGQGSGNVAKAKSMLTAAGYTGVGTALRNPSGQAVSISCSYTTGNTLRQQTCQIVQSELAALGITVPIDPTSDIGGVLTKGQFDLVDFAWVGTPFVVAGAQQIWELTGGGDFGKNNDPAMERLINEAAAQTDPTKTEALMDQADTLLTADAYVLPLFQKPTFLAAYSNIVNLRDNATSVGPPYNVQAWGSTS